MRPPVCALLALLLATAAVAAEPGAEAPSAVQKSDNNFVLGGPLPAWVQALADIPPTSRRDPVVFRLRETQSLVGDVPAVLVNQAIQVNDPSALAAIGQYAIDYAPGYQKLTLHRVAILRGGEVLDRTRQTSIRVLQQEQQVQNGVYGGANTVQLLLDDVRVGDTLWITYSTEGANPVFGKRWSDEYSWDLGAPLELRRLTVLHPRKRPLRWRQLGDMKADALKPVIEQAGDMERIRFEGKGLEAIEAEPSTPADFTPRRLIQMSEYDSWQGVAGWAAALFPAAAPGPEGQALVRQFAQAPDKAAQAAAALHWVQDEIRYFSVSIGENSHRPQAPEVVLRRRYGDCKDKAYLLVSLLAQLGIEARPVLVNAQAPAMPGKVTPSPTWFDHVIVGIDLDGQTWYVDPTRSGQKGALTQLPAPFPGAPALPVDAAATALVKLPERDAGLPGIEHVDRVVIDAFDGDAVLESRDIYRGDYADSARRRLPAMSANELKKSALGQYEKTYPGLSLVEAPRFEDKVEQGSFEVVAKFRLPKPVEHAGGKYSLPYTSQIIEGTLGIPNNLSRQFPFAYPSGKYAGRYRLRIVWPKDVRHVGQVQAKTIDNAFLRVHEEYTFRGNYLDYLLDYRLKSDRIAAADLPALQKQARQLYPYAEASFHVTESAVLDGLAAQPLRHIDAMRSQLAFKRSQKKLKAGKGAELDPDDVCDALHDSATLRELDLPGSVASMDGLLDSLRQDARPKLAACVGDVLFARGDFDGAIAAFGRARLSDKDPDHATLAWARLHARDPRGAVAEMTRFVAARAAEGELNALDTADAAALVRRAGEALPRELAAAAREWPDGPWPRPLLALQAGAITPDALLAQAEAQPGDARDLALDEAWLQIAQQRLAGGDRRGARVALQRVRAHAVYGTRAHGRALAELAALESNDPDYRAGTKASRQGDDKAAAAAWTRAAQRGVAEAQFRLGLAYHYGDGVKQDQAAAAPWFRLAAQQEHASGANMWGLYLMDGLGGVDRDRAAANDWYRRGAELGDEVAALNLGRNHLDGRGIARDAAQGVRYLLQAAELGNLEAQPLLAWRYADGNGVRKDDDAAAYWADLAAMRGSDIGHVYLGRLLWEGRGVDKDPALGTRHIREAADHGDVTAWYFMGEALAFGHGIEKDPALAFQWFQKAAQEDHAFAKLQVGIAYMVGKGVAQDKKLGVIWLEHAAGDGIVQANAMLGGVYAQGEGAPVDLTRAAANYRKAARAGHCEAMEGLAALYEGGKGVAADLRMAHVYYALAAQSGDAAVTCPAAAGKAGKLARRLDAAQLASAQASVKAWKVREPLPDEKPEAAARL
jgi:TPR repeat protein/transglutaminase-like putative cysteine protease